MRSMERSKKKLQPWKKSLLHFFLCFIMGFFTGFAPTAKSSILSNRVAISNPSCTKPYRSVQKGTNQLTSQNGNFNRSLLDTTSEPLPTRSNDAKRLVIIVTSTSAKDQLRGVLLARMANTLKLVRPPLLWVVVEQKSESSSEVSEMLRETGIMYRHLVFKENFTDIEAEMDHQWNVALEHIEHHKLSGIVHFTGLSNVYDLSFFEQTRGIEVFGTWPIAILAANRKRVVFKRPVCDSSQDRRWHLKKFQNPTDTKPPLHISSFAFNSSILWDPERWGRTSSLQDTSQDSLKFVRKEIIQEETRVKGVPQESCSKILLWNLDISRGIISHHGHR